VGLALCSALRGHVPSTRSVQGPPSGWDGAVLDEVEKQRRERLPEAALKKRQLWRDQCLMALRRHASDVGQEAAN